MARAIRLAEQDGSPTQPGPRVGRMLERELAVVDEEDDGHHATRHASSPAMAQVCDRGLAAT